MTTNFSLKSSYKYLIFDFDGTINNTAPGITATFKATLDIFGVDYSKVDFTDHIGPPLKHSFDILVGQDRCQEAIDTFRRIFEQTNALKNSHIYPGIDKLLPLLKQRGYVLSIATSKHEPFAVESLDFLGIAQHFDVVYGQNEHRGYKNEILRQLIADHGWDKADCLMIGDTCYDVDGAKANGIDVLAVSYGFEDKATLLAHNPNALVDTVSEMAQLLCGETL